MAYCDRESVLCLTEDREQAWQRRDSLTRAFAHLEAQSSISTENLDTLARGPWLQSWLNYGFSVLGRLVRFHPLEFGETLYGY